MHKMRVMINGMGKMGDAISEYFAKSGIEICPYSLSGAARSGQVYHVKGGPVLELIGADDTDKLTRILTSEERPDIIVDYTTSDAAYANVQLYCKHNIPFVMGTSINGNKEDIYDLIRNSKTSAVIAPNMAEETVRMIYELESLAQHSPGIYKGYGVEFIESHQEAKGKKLSATAKHIVPILQELGLDIDNDRVIVCREPARQLNELHVPEEYLGGHSWHIIKITPPPGSPEEVKVYQTRINGRVPYAEGTLDAVKFLHQKVLASGKGEIGKVYSMEAVFGLTEE